MSGFEHFNPESEHFFNSRYYGVFSKVVIIKFLFLLA